MQSRRAFVRHGSLGMLALPWLSAREWGAWSSSARPYREAAEAAFRWLAATARWQQDGVCVWPAAPLEAPDAAITWDLYNGQVGITFALLERHRFAPDADSRRLLDSSLRAVATAIETGAIAGAGLYDGLAGASWLLAQAAVVLGDSGWARVARRAIAQLAASATRTADGDLRWSASNDIISGLSGIIVTLDRLRVALAQPELAQPLRNAAAELLRVGEAQQTGRRWRMDAEFPRVMPNFSHGTAGAAYALARAHAATDDARFLAAARDGAAHLLTLNTEPADGLAICHHTPGGEQLFYQSWCHGPAGTARLFDYLALQADRSMGVYAPRALVSIERSGAPLRQSAGYWNNISQCCGHAGIGEFALGLHARTQDPRALALAQRAADDLLARGTRDADRVRWPQAENRGDPAGVQAQTGFMQGAAGVMVFLLHLDARQHGGPTPLDLPDAHWYTPA